MPQGASSHPARQVVEDRQGQVLVAQGQLNGALGQGVRGLPRLLAVQPRQAGEADDLLRAQLDLVLV